MAEEKEPKKEEDEAEKNAYVLKKFKGRPLLKDVSFKKGKDQ